MRCCSKFKQKVTDLKFSSCSASNCCCSWLCFLPEGVLGSSNVSSWLARSVSTSFSANKLFRSSWRTATCQGTIWFRPAFAKWYDFLLRWIKYTTKSIVNSAEGMCDVWPLFGQLFHAKQQSHIWALKNTPSITENSLPLPAVKANSAVNPCWKKRTDKVHFKQTC